MKIKTKPKAIKLVAAVLSFLMISSVLPFFAVTASAAGITPTTPQKDTGGVYQIGTAEELYGFAQLVNSKTERNPSAVLTKDIVVNTGVLKADGNLADDTSGFTSWTPIGNLSNKYTGKFDGQGHTVSGLYFNNPSTSEVGLFGYLYSGGEIKNVGVIDSYFGGRGRVGGVCGANEGTINGCYNTGTVSGSVGVGGVCGVNQDGTIIGCYNTGTVSGSGDNVGGVCGHNHQGTITASYNTGTVSGSGDNVGGVCGYNYCGTITGCYNTGTVSGNGDYVGGVCGYNDVGTITACYNTGTVSGNTYVGGVCGHYQAGTITGCYTNNDTGSVCGGGSGTVTDCDVKTDAEFADGTVCGLLNTALKNENSDVHFYQGVKLPELIRTPQLVGGVYQIGTLTELFGFAQLVNSGNKGAKAVLTKDIVVNTGVLKADGILNTGTFTSWTPIGNSSNNKYTGTFDGQGHTISGLYFNDTNTEFVGLFGYLGENGEIKNTGVIDSYFNGKNYVGGVCGENNSGTITGCYNTGTVSGSGNYVGGVCGRNYNGTITGCYNTGTVSGSGNYVGGVYGYNKGTITGCYNTGTVSGTSDYVGGVCGYNSLKITGCYNTGTVSGNNNVGGVCGMNRGTIPGCYNTGTVSGNTDVGGVCGINSGTIARCYTNNGNVYGNNTGTVTVYGVKSDEEFKNGTVCEDLNIALKNQNSDVRFYQGVKSPEFIRTPQLVNNVYQISCASELYGFAQLVNGGNTDQNTKAVLTADIVVNTGVLKADGNLADDTSGFTSWTPIGNDSNTYIGTFDGQGHTISGLYFNDTSTSNVGLFGINKGTIKNVGVIDSYFNVCWGIGGVCGNNYGTITDCYNTGTVIGSGGNVGGVCGYNEGTITGCYNTGTVSGDLKVGGVCGDNEGTITGCYNIGTVSGTNYVGGVCEYNNSTITGCYTNRAKDAYYVSDTAFTDGTVCKLLNTALKNASSKVLFCQRIGTDASPLFDYQIEEHTPIYTVENNTFKFVCVCGKKTAKTMELTLKTEKAVVANGADNTLTATLSNYDNEVVTYKWYQDNVPIENATSSTYKMPADLPLGTYTYKVEVTMAGVGTITQSVDVLVDIAPQYYVNIPATVNIGDNFTVEASNVLLKNNAKLNVSLLSDFTLSTSKGASLNYEILTSNSKLTSGATLLTVAGSENPTAPGSGTSDTYNVALAQGEKPKYSGNYTDTLTFTIKVEP